MTDMPTLLDVCPAVYVSSTHGIMTTGSYITPTDDSNLHQQLLDEIQKFENEKELTIISQVDCWTVHAPERFAPIGRIYALAMLSPTYRKG